MTAEDMAEQARLHREVADVFEFLGNQATAADITDRQRMPDDRVTVDAPSWMDSKRLNFSFCELCCTAIHQKKHIKRLGRFMLKYVIEWDGHNKPAPQEP